jgi:hypothetical protein
MAEGYIDVNISFGDGDGLITVSVIAEGVKAVEAAGESEQAEDEGKGDSGEHEKLLYI